MTFKYLVYSGNMLPVPCHVLLGVAVWWWQFRWNM